MTQQERLVVNTLKSFATAIMSDKVSFVDDAVDNFMEDAQVAFSQEGRQEIIDHLKKLVQ